jgi:RimJ/RimL family protein N-acetyltransferase
MKKDLFNGDLVRLAAADLEAAAEAFALWSLDSEYYRLLVSDACHLWSKIKTKEWLEKDLLSCKPDLYSFMIHTLDGDRLIGEIGLDGVKYTHGDAFVGIGLGERDFWGKGYGTDAMRVLLRFAFTELNLRRISLDVFEYNPRAVRSYEKAGFIVEGRMRGMLQREGKRWDLIFMGILREEWERL